MYCNSPNSTLVLQDLPSLTTLTSESSSFKGVDTVVFSNIPNITTISLPNAFENASNRSISNASSLETFVNSITTAYTVDDLLAVGNHTREIIIPSNTFNNGEVSEIEFSSLPALNRIAIGDFALNGVSRFILYDLRNLTSLTVGRQSLASSARRLSDMDSIFFIHDCDVLTSIVVDEGSFSLLSELSLVNLPLLTTFDIGFHSFSSVVTVTLDSLNSLTEVSIDERGEVHTPSTLTMSFIQYDHPILIHNNITELTIPSNASLALPTFNLMGFPDLTKLIIGDGSFSSVLEFAVKEVPQLKSIVVGQSSLNNVGTVVLKDLASLESL